MQTTTFVEQLDEDDLVPGRRTYRRNGRGRARWQHDAALDVARRGTRRPLAVTR